MQGSKSTRSRIPDPDPQHCYIRKLNCLYVHMYNILQTGSGKGTVSSSLGSLLPDDDNKHQDVTTADRNVDVSASDHADDAMLSMTPEKAATLDSIAEPSGEAAAAKGVTASAGKKPVEPSASNEATTAAKSAVAVEMAAKEVAGVLSAKSGPPAAAGVAEPAARGETTTGQKKSRMRSFPDRNSSSSSLGFVSRFNSSASAPVSENEVTGSLALCLGSCNK